MMFGFPGAVAADRLVIVAVRNVSAVRSVRLLGVQTGCDHLRLRPIARNATPTAWT
jgi:hypothetical protein